ncbi:MAG: S-layer homology domain-containing protein [Clostridia bacterium]|nr:S-layer homology domain-containing protein [Clostridia bacterium]
MRNKLRRFISALTAIVMLLSMVPNVFGSAAEQFTDFPTGWSKPAMEAAVANGLLTGYDSNEIRPTANLTRAEFAAIIARAFGAKTVADISQYSDVSKDDWYYDYIAKVVKMGAMNGVSNTAMNPDANITREEVFTAVARVLVLSDSDISGLSKFKDSAKVSSWAANSMSALAKRGYVNGDDLGNANPGANITREEFAQFMYNAIRTYITKNGTYDKDMEGIVVLRAGDVELKNLSITSDLVIGDGVLEDSVKITNVKVEKRLLTRGGTITLKNTTLGENVVVNNVNGITSFKNYRDEKVFNGIVENTEAKFLTRRASSGGSGPSDPTKITVTIDGREKTLDAGTTIDSLTPPAELGYKFDYWFYDSLGTQSIPSGTVLTDGMAVYSKKTPKEYPLSYFDEDGTTPITFETGYSAAPSFNIENKDTTVLPASTNINKPGWKLVKWVNMSTGADVPPLTVTADMTETDGVKLKAVFELIDFDIAFADWKVEGETSTETFNADTMFTDAYKLSKAEKFNISVGIKDGKLLPTNSDIKHPGYKFLKWVDKNGDEVTNANIKDRITAGVVSASTTTLNLTAVFEVIDFNIAFTKWKVDGETDLKTFNDSMFASGYQKAEKFNVVSGIKDSRALPTDNDIENTGYELVKLVDESGAEVTDANIKDFIQDLVEGSKTTLNIVAVFKIKPYEIVFKHKSYEKKEDLSYDLIGEGDFSTTDWFTTDVETDFDIENPYTLPLQSKVSRLGYKFLGWYDENDIKLTTPISVDENTPDEKVVYAKFELIKYQLNFQSVIENADGTLESAEKFKKDWFITIPQSVFDVRAPYELPLDGNIYRPGYTFLGWYDANNNIVTELTVNENTNQFGEKVYARFKMNNYTVKFYTGGVGSQPHKSYTYNILNYNGELEPGVTFADVHKSLVLDSNKVFVNWYELVDDGQGGLKQQLISGLTEEHLYKVDGTILDVYANTNDYAPLKIQFFKGYKQPTSIANELVLLEEEQGGWYYNYHKTKFDADINTEALKGSSAGLYDKSKYVDIYPSGSEYTVTPDFWYLKNGQFKPFEELFTDPDTTDDVDEYTIRVQGDPSATEEQVYENDGYLLYKNFRVMVNFGNLSYGPIEAIDIDTKYSTTSRVADSVKVLGDQIGQWIERLENWSPELYNKLTGEVYEKLEEKDLIDEDQNIKITKIPMHIKNLVSLFTDKYDSLLDGDSFEIKKAYIPYILELEEDIEGMTFDDVIEKSNNAAIERLVNFIGKDTLSDAFDRANDNYIAGLNEKIAIVEASSDPDAKETYTAYETFEIDVIDEILRPVYGKAQPKAVEKLESIDRLKYNENDKLQYLVEHDVFEKLLTEINTTDPELTGYQIKDVIDYYNYVLGLFIVADDAICYYGDELTEEEFEAIKDAAFEKFYIVKDKVDEILADYAGTGELPEQVENLLEKVQRINDLFLQMEGRLKSLIDKYLNTNLDNLDENQKAQYVIDVFFGEEEPTFTIDTLYAIFYAYDDAVQAKMQDALNSGKLQTAIAKFEASPFGKLFTSTNADESLLALLTNIANNGVDQYKVANDDVTIQDVYKFVVAGNEFTLRRTYMKD